MVSGTCCANMEKPAVVTLLLGWHLGSPRDGVRLVARGSGGVWGVQSYRGSTKSIPSQSQIYSFYLKLKTSEFETRRKIKLLRKETKLHGTFRFDCDFQGIHALGSFLCCVFCLHFWPVSKHSSCVLITQIQPRCSLNGHGWNRPGHLHSHRQAWQSRERIHSSFYRSLDPVSFFYLYFSSPPHI